MTDNSTYRDVDSGRVVWHEGVGRLATLAWDVAEYLERPVKPFYAGIYSCLMILANAECFIFLNFQNIFLFFKNIRCWILHLECKREWDFSAIVWSL